MGRRLHSQHLHQFPYFPLTLCNQTHSLILSGRILGRIQPKYEVVQESGWALHALLERRLVFQIEAQTHRQKDSLLHHREVRVVSVAGVRFNPTPRVRGTLGFPGFVFIPRVQHEAAISAEKVDRLVWSAARLHVEVAQSATLLGLFGPVVGRTAGVCHNEWNSVGKIG